MLPGGPEAALKRASLYLYVDGVLGGCITCSFSRHLICSIPDFYYVTRPGGS